MNHLSHRAAAERRMHSKHLHEVDFDKAPFTVLWEVTRACALACRHCRAKAQPKPDPRQLTTEESLRLIDQIAEFGSPILVFTGGDPMMRRDLEQLIRYASQEKGLRTSLTPSSTALVTKKRLKSVMDAGIRRIALSLDGPNAEIHDSFRGFSGSFQRTMEILRDAQDVGLSVQVNTTVTKINLQYLEEMVPFLEKYGAVQWSLFFLVPVGRARIEDMISPQEHEQVYNWLYDLSLIETT
jgi:MoaA/NifB/PqqE/SkfB family radical SAM enzyme